MAAHSSIALNSHPQPHYHNLPYAKNKKFYGREDILHQIEGSLSSSTESPASVLLHGLGGIGKTEIALAYAWQNLAKFGCILWINCSSAISIERDLTAAAQGLRLRGVVPQDHYLNRQILLQWLESTSSRWLLVFDNLDDCHHLVEEIWPRSGDGAVIVTSRRPYMRSTSSFIEVREFSKAEGTEFLLSLLSGRQAGDESEAASELCGLLGGHALAIDQMASLIHKRSWGFREFLQIYRSHKDVILGSKDGSGSYEHKIGNVWDMTFNELDQPAAALLGVMSFVDPDSIPGALFEPRDLDLLPPSLDFCVDQWSTTEALVKLCTLSLIRRVSDDTFSIHRLVQDHFRRYMRNRQDHFEAAIALLSDKVPKDDIEQGWSEYEKYALHEQMIRRHHEENRRAGDSLQASSDFVH